MGDIDTVAIKSYRRDLAIRDLAAMQHPGLAKITPIPGEPAGHDGVRAEALVQTSHELAAVDMQSIREHVDPGEIWPSELLCERGEPHLEPVLGRERPRIGAVRLLSGENATHTKVRGKTGTADNAPIDARPERHKRPRGVPRVRRSRGAPASTTKPREAAPHHPWCA